MTEVTAYETRTITGEFAMNTVCHGWPRAGSGPWLILLGVLLAVALPTIATDGGAPVEDEAYLSFDDFPRETPIEYPDWFNPRFLDLRADLDAAIARGKAGLLLYFGQQRCAYCYQLINVNFNDPNIVEYTKKHFDLVPIYIWGVAEVTDLDGATLTEQAFAARENTTFTPALLFIDRKGREVMRLLGYYPPYQFRAALEYVADAHYERESFRDYLARGDNRMVFDAEDLNEQTFFSAPPYQLDRSHFPSQRPLAVFFEQGDCHACDVLHGQALVQPAIRDRFAEIDSVQLNMWSDTPVVTPDGRVRTARQWAADLGLYYAPSVLFFDERGREILRIDSVVGFYRLRGVLNYVTSKAYLDEPDYQRWRHTRAF